MKTKQREENAAYVLRLATALTNGELRMSGTKAAVGVARMAKIGRTPEAAESVSTTTKSQPTHIDEWLDTPPRDPSPGERYARLFFEIFRLPAWKRMIYPSSVVNMRLFCTYKGQRYRVTGCSVLGDVWLNDNLTSDIGYKLRVIVTDCSDWSEWCYY